jgi:mRNA interferase MazF
VKRGEVWTVSGGPDYAGKPRPAVIVQDDAFDATASITICPFTTHAAAAPLLRLTIEPSPENGLRAVSQLMIDKVTTVSKNKLESRVGRLSVEDIVRLNRAVLVFLGLAGSASSARRAKAVAPKRKARRRTQSHSPVSVARANRSNGFL